METVRITDVAPRDGLQNEPDPIPTEAKIRMVEHLVASGVAEVEVSSFVSARWIPQLADAAAVFDGLRGLDRGGTVFSALVPNEKGLGQALAVNAGGDRRMIDKVSVFTAASDTFSKKNTNATIVETIERFRPMMVTAHAEGLPVRGYVSCVIACPFEGAIAPERVADVCGLLLDLGVDELDLGDTIGAGTPESLTPLLEKLYQRLGETVMQRATLHLHDTNGRAVDCVRLALDAGMRSFDGAAGGLGGCPYASTPGKRAPGNIATQALVRAIEDAGFATGVDVAALDRAAGAVSK